jgi:hypothetical protein
LDLVSCDFWLFETLKRKLEESTFENPVEVLTAVSTILSTSQHFSALLSTSQHFSARFLSMNLSHYLINGSADCVNALVDEGISLN